MKRFGSQIHIVHFIGTAKPWHQQINTETGSVMPADEISSQSMQYLNYWWHIFFTEVKPKINPAVVSALHSLHCHCSFYFGVLVRLDIAY